MSSTLVMTLGLVGALGAGTAAGEPWWEFVQGTWSQEALALASGGDDRIEHEDDLDMRPRGSKPPWLAHWRGDETEILERPRWVKHVVRPRERLSQIAARYGVSMKELREQNDIKAGVFRVKARRKLRIKARRIPPAREKITHVVVDGDSWGTIAASYRVETPDLHSWNFRNRTLDPGETLTLWVDPGLAWTVGRRQGDPELSFEDVADGAKSVGRPNYGRLQDGVPIPENTQLYTLRDKPGMLYGSTHAIRSMIGAFAAFRAKTGYEGMVMIGSMSRRRGGKFPPHRSHRTGRDVDIRLPLLPGVPVRHDPNRDEIDWYAAWGLIEALIDTGEVEVIFLETDLQRRLYEAARAMGRSHESLDDAITWPREQGKPRALVRHAEGHDGHIHVRFLCGPDEERCKRPRTVVDRLRGHAEQPPHDENEEGPP